MESKWYAWVLKRNRLSNVLQYIQTRVPEIDKYFYPQIKKEYSSNKRSRISNIPLYEGYLFLHYHNEIEVYQKLKSYPFITTFVGEVFDREIQEMEASQGKLLSEIKASKFSKGDSVTLLSGPFTGFEGKVLGVKVDQIQVRIEANLLGQQGVDLIFKEGQIKHKNNLTNTSVQEI